ncbi:hypothetical protein NDQ72_13860 [Halomonas sp. KG2]|uniref:hypothetical protein n=1 Tax=Halomonas sp. KG2 TaxID=2951138 RepID=UPI0026475F2E|nr:hypothetical protein [Halomonas sp. KG2]WKD27139.1 hypothetical protein NDQ72_13860 [Halomonas sp. KG2]
MRIEDMSIDQLLELNQYICQRIDELQEQETLQALSQLRVGLKVTFEGREGPVLGIVTKINRKSAIVLGEDGRKQYKVSPELLRPLRDVK